MGDNSVPHTEGSSSESEQEGLIMSSTSVVKAGPAEVAGLAPAFTVGQAVAGFEDFDAATKQVQEEATIGAKVRGHVMWNAALHAHYALDTARGELIGEGNRWADQGQYAAAMGYGKSSGTLLKRLGRAAVVHKVRRGSATWTFLASHAQRAEVGKAIALDSTEEFNAEVKRLATNWSKLGTVKDGPDKREGQPSDGSDTAGNGGDPTEGQQPEARDVTVGEVLDLLDTMVKSLTREDWAAVENRLDRIVTRENTIRAEAAKG